MVFEGFLVTIRSAVFSGQQFFLASAEITVFIRLFAVFYRYKGVAVFLGNLLELAWKTHALFMLNGAKTEPKSIIPAAFLGQIHEIVRFLCQGQKWGLGSL